MEHLISVTPVLLVGGGGSRLWPMSTPAVPKQFATLTSERSIMAETLARVCPGADEPQGIQFSGPIIVGSQGHHQLLEQVLKHSGISQPSMILEPCPRNTAPAIASAALSLEDEGCGDRLMLVLPSDHHIADVPAFHSAISAAAEAAAQGRLVTFGITPTHAETGYGYIKRAEPQGKAFAVERFVEKPEPEQARQYVASGDYDWNAGIFMFRASTIVKFLAREAPDVLDCARKALTDAERRMSSIMLDRAAFSRCPTISIDDAVMAKGGAISVVPVSMGWSDIGSWRAIHAVRHHDEQGNSEHGRVIAFDTSNSLLHADDGMIAAIGVGDLAIVKSGDTVLVTTFEGSQSVRSIEHCLAKTTLAGEPNAELNGFEPSSARFTTWMREHALPLWAEHSWDRERGGFREFLGMDGRPSIEPFRRVRVQARQIFVFAAAHLTGWNGSALELASEGFEYLVEKGWLPTGGWAHKLDDEGRVIDEMRDAYDHAFVLLALAWLHRATGASEPLYWADRTLAWLDSVLVDTRHGGFHESVPGMLPRRANPHMHLLEALLALYDATRNTSYLDRADRLVHLFRQRFIDRQSGSLREFFKDDWTPATGDEGQVREPGHHFEWAWLLDRYQSRLGGQCADEITRLAAFADRYGTSDETGLVYDTVDEQGRVLSTSHRLWCQTEALRAHLMLAERGDDNQSVNFAKLMDAVFRFHLSINPVGLWHDRVDLGGNPTNETVPASTLYHLMTLFWDLDARFAQTGDER